MSYGIIIAEDEPPLADHLRAPAHELSHEVVAIADSGPAAIAAVSRHGPDLVLMDIKLPGMDGITAARTIARDNGIPTIIISALGELQAAIDLTMARFRELQALRREVGDLRHALAQRKMVERAKGILMDMHGWPKGEAFRRLQLQSQRENRRMIDVAQAVITAHALSDGDAGT